jgi:hypothetical protein
MVSAILARLDPEYAQIYQQKSEEFVARGIGYGLYGQNDADAAQSLVNQYFVLLENSPTATDMFRPIIPAIQ